MKPGTRALWFAVFLVIVGAVLTYLLHDSAPFGVSAGATGLGKFGYDAMRDRDGFVGGSGRTEAFDEL